MSLNSTPMANRVHIGFFGRRNAGKSSIVNAVTGQDLAVVSDTKGTTTDPVYKSMELLPLGPVVIIDTPGYDDEGALGELRIKKTKQVLNKTDVAVLVVDATEGMLEADRELILLFKAKEIPFVVAFNKADIADAGNAIGTELDLESGKAMYVSALKKEGIFELKELIGKSVQTDDLTHKLVGDLIGPDDFVVLVVPIDSAAPKGRLILPQQQAIRDVLESGAAAIVVRESELEMTLKNLGKKPSVVITDSQAFGFVSKIVPDDIYLTSFSILMARYKGFLKTALDGVKTVDGLASGDKILISEGCTHHRQCGDIGTVKIPKWLKEHTGLDVYAGALPEGVNEGLIMETTSGTEFPEDVSQYKLVIHCGGCMLNEREIKYRMKCSTDQGVPFLNYGIFIAYVHGILNRSVEIILDKTGI